jgi:hypothetical protein
MRHELKGSQGRIWTLPRLRSAGVSPAGSGGVPPLEVAGDPGGTPGEPTGETSALRGAAGCTRFQLNKDSLAVRKLRTAAAGEIAPRCTRLTVDESFRSGHAYGNTSVAMPYVR